MWRDALLSVDMGGGRASVPPQGDGGTDLGDFLGAASPSPRSRWEGGGRKWGEEERREVELGLECKIY